MSIFWLALPVAIACGVIEGKRRGRVLLEQDKARQAKTLAGIEAEKRQGEAAAVWRILMNVYTKLRQAGASLRTPWISGCIAAIEAGKDCPPKAAIWALLKTGEDLAGSRWDTDKMAEIFGKAAEKLAALI